MAASFQTIRTSFLLMLALGVLSLLGGCSAATQQTLSDSVNADLASQPTIYSDNWVRLSPVQIYVHPDGPPRTAPTALFVPFRITQQMENASGIGFNLSRLLWQAFLQSSKMPTIEMAQIPTPYRPDIALSLAQQRGADLVVGGYITHFMDGGTVGDSVVSISLEIYDVRTKSLLWSMAQGGLMPRATVSDYLLFATQSRMPTDPVAAVVFALGTSFGNQLANWIVPPPPTPPAKPWYSIQPKAF